MILLNFINGNLDLVENITHFLIKEIELPLVNHFILQKMLNKVKPKIPSTNMITIKITIATQEIMKAFSHPVSK